MRLVLLITLLAAPAVLAQAPARYADVRLSGERLAERLAAAGVGIDHAEAGKAADGTPSLRTVLSVRDLDAARAAGLAVDVITADVAAARRGGACPTPPAPITGTMGCYPTFDEAVAILDQMRAEFPALVSARTSIGTTGEGRSVWMVEVGDNPGVDEGEPEMLLTSLHHAREPEGLVSVLLSLWDLLRGGAAGDAEAQFLLANRRLFVVPVLNPDGYVYNQTTNPAGGGLWRKNRRANAGGTRGVDLNRNYAYEWGRDDIGSSPNGGSETYRGTAAFSEPETAAIRAFVEAHRIRVAMNYHSYSNDLIYPWGFEEDLYTPDSAAFVEQAVRLTADNGYVYGTGNQTVGYVTNGDSDDWMYGAAAARPAIFAYTPEVGSADDGFWPGPSRIVPIAQENLRANRLAMRFAGATPVVARVAVVGEGNGFLDPGESAALRVVVYNLGRSDLTGGLRAHLASTNPRVTVSGEALTISQTLAPGDSVVLGPFTVQTDAQTPLGALTGLSLETTLVSESFTEALALPTITVGTPETVFSDDATSLARWTPAGAPAATGWGLTPTVFTSAPTAFADSPTGTYTANTDRTLTLTAPLALTGTERLRFQIKVDTEPNYDVATVEAQVGAGPWTPLAGRLTVPSTGAAPFPIGTPVYTGTQPFRAEEVSLASVAGPSVRLRFRLRSDGSQQRDGVAVDDIRLERLVNGSGVVASEPGAAPAAAALGWPIAEPGARARPDPGHAAPVGRRGNGCGRPRPPRRCAGRRGRRRRVGHGAGRARRLRRPPAERAGRGNAPRRRAVDRLPSTLRRPMRLADLDASSARFQTSADAFDALHAACDASPHIATFETIGHSEEGRPIAGVTLGTGPRVVTLMAGAHADEPVGPETLRLLILDGLAMQGWGAPDGGLEALFEQVTFRIVPHVNPDAEARNAAWISRFDASRPIDSLTAYLRHRLREAPGRDVEFAFPDGRPETAAVSRFLFSAGPPALHASLHGMGFSEGALLLIDRDHLEATATEALREGFRRAAARAGLRLHDHDRGGDKGFRYGGPGFTSTPLGAAMRAHFLGVDDPETASRFGLSSMETAALGAPDVLSVVTELPLFVLDAETERVPGVPGLLHRWTALQPDIAEALSRSDDLGPLVAPLGLRAFDVPTAVRLHLETLDLALGAL